MNDEPITVYIFREAEGTDGCSVVALAETGHMLMEEIVRYDPDDTGAWVNVALGLAAENLDAMYGDAPDAYQVVVLDELISKPEEFPDEVKVAFDLYMQHPADEYDRYVAPADRATVARSIRAAEEARSEVAR